MKCSNRHDKDIQTSWILFDNIHIQFHVIRIWFVCSKQKEISTAGPVSVPSPRKSTLKRRTVGSLAPPLCTQHDIIFTFVGKKGLQT
jgi:hypothetical protein